MDNESLMERLARVEETAVFQDRQLAMLNEALIGQQHQLDRAERTVERLYARLESLHDLIEASGGPANTRPPHYS